MRFAWLGVLALSACTLDSVATGVCGNGVIEDNEDCDSSADYCVGCGIACESGGCPDSDPMSDDNKFAGYVCGADDFCHAPSGTFDVPHAPIPFAAQQIAIGPVGMSSYGDVVGITPTSLNVRYGDQAASLDTEHTLITPSQNGLASVAHIVDDETLDIFVPTRDGFAVYAPSYGILTPRAFPFVFGGGGGGTDNRPIDADPFAGGKRLLLYQLDSVQQTITFGVLPFDAMPEPFAYNPCGGPLAVQRYLPLTKDLYPLANGGAVVSFGIRVMTNVSVCTMEIIPLANPPLGGPSYQFKPLVVTPPNAVKSRRILADLNSDGCPSLLEAEPDTISPVTNVYEYAGTGTPGSCAIASSRVKVTSLDNVFANEDTLLAAVPNERNNGYRSSLLVTRSGVYAIPPSSTAPPVLMYRSDRQLLGAVIADFDDDGDPDVAVRAGAALGNTILYEPNVDILYYHTAMSGPGNFLLWRIGTGRAVDLITGDFDGNRRVDLGYLEQVGDQQRLLVAYGTADRLLPGIAVDTFTNVVGMYPIAFTDSADPFSLVDDLVVADQPGLTGPDPTQLTLLHGTVQRAMIAYFDPAEEASDVGATGVTYLGLVGGNLAATDPVDGPDVVSFAVSKVMSGANVFLSRGDRTGRFGQTTTATTTQLGTCSDSSTSNVLLCVGGAKFLSYPTDELLGTTTETHREVIIGVDNRPMPAMISLDPSAITGDPNLMTKPNIDASITRVDLPLPMGGKIQSLRNTDIDGDGHDELVLAFGPRSAGAVRICQVSTKGIPTDCSVDVASLIEVTEGETWRCHAATVANLSLAEPLEVVALCWSAPDGASAVFRIDHDGSHYTAERLAGIPGAPDTLEAGDVNGDGIDDLVLLTAAEGQTAIQVVPQCEKRFANCGDRLETEVMK